MKRYPVECLLRPLVEWPAAAVLLSAAIGIAFLPEVFWLPPVVLDAEDAWRVMPWAQWLIVAALALAGLRRCVQLVTLLRYRTALRRLPRYALASPAIPHRASELFLGRGFRWDERHTRRVFEASREAAKPFLQPTLWDRWRSRMPADEGGNPALHGVGSLEQSDTDIWISDADRMGHVLVVGTTGVGKSRLAEILVAQDIRRGGPVIVLDPKGDKDLMLQMAATCDAAGRKADFLCFHLAYPEFSARYNPFGNFARVTEIAGRIRESLPDSGNSAAFAEFSWSYVNTIAVALHALGRRTTIATLLQHATNIEPLVGDYLAKLLDTGAQGWKSQLPAEMEAVADRIKRNQIPRAQADRRPDTLAMLALVERYRLIDDVAQRVLKVFSYDRNYHDKLVSSLFPLLQKMSTGAIAAILSPDYDDVTDPRPILDFETALRANKVVYIGLDALTDSVVAKAVGSSMFADITSLAGRIYNYTRGQGLSDAVVRTHHRVRLHADEFNEIIGDSFIPLLNKARGAGFDVTAYTQSRADITVGFDDKNKGAQAEDNFNTLIMMRVRSEATARLLIDQLPEVKVPTIMWGSASTDSTQPGIAFTSSQTQRISEERTTLVTPADLASLPRGQAFVSMQGGRIFKLRFPLPLPASSVLTIPKLAESLLARRTTKGSEPWRAVPPPWRHEPEHTA